MEAVNNRLHELAGLYGVQVSYWDAWGNQRWASDDALVAILRALGAEVDHPDDAGEAVRARHAVIASRSLEPCRVAWDGRIELPAGELLLESGERWTVDGAVELPTGYHRLCTDSGECSILSAPSQCWAPEQQRRSWGLFAPLYGLRSRRSDAVGGPDFGDLRQLIHWVADRGGSAVGTLPLLAAFLYDEESDPSPYLPVSRRFWNELYLELDGVPDATEAAALALTDTFEYVRLMNLRRGALEPLAQAAGDSLEQFAAEFPEVDRYARFRAVAERRRQSWRQWPASHGAALPDGDIDQSARRYHLYVQQRARQELGALSQVARERECALYLDLPVGVHPDGYDLWADRDSFAEGVSAGAPPDPVFHGGQDWGVPPLHPERTRELGHRYLAECVRAHLEFAGVLRVDHAMGLHRLYWVPQGMGPLDGTYVHYAAEEQFAVLSIESHRARSVVVGEDLGTVPDVVREQMSQRRMRRIHVAQFGIHPGGYIEPPPADSVASVNTHDMPPFSGYWRGRDILARQSLGLLSPEQAAEEHHGRQQLVRELAGDERAALLRLLSELSHSEAWLMLVTLEDLWQEQRAQNQPGTSALSHPNWRNKLRYAIDELDQRGEVTEALAQVAAIRPR